MDFLVQSINHRDADEIGLRDVVDIPFQDNGVPGEVKLIVPFTDPTMVGRFVFHCHIVEHEDNGMMANVVVLPPGINSMPLATMRTVGSAGSRFAAPSSLRGPAGVDGLLATAQALSNPLQRWLGRVPAFDALALEAPICRTRVVQ
ncbi:MAG: multicopper oxidase domain-containing protein [Caldimonas sp.]